uniref:AlNc14C1091G12772 protein n=1 Tax=Albugo laibachii Nc14 TaxID=890382 RepID=F0X2I1_9STRA|nr:AlNc14C1091G12772 [Albugo laibachii Nc14]|eukprot:CCA28082.1 AlNc14C1091G12772 [Albugo laibachii Nc14]
MHNIFTSTSATNYSGIFSATCISNRNEKENETGIGKRQAKRVMYQVQFSSCFSKNTTKRHRNKKCFT